MTGLDAKYRAITRDQFDRHIRIVGAIISSATAKGHSALTTPLADRGAEASANLPYPWCRKPDVCKDLGYCPLDPNCGD